MDTLTCAKCFSEVTPENLGPHQEWHARLTGMLAGVHAMVSIAQGGPFALLDRQDFIDQSIEIVKKENL